MLPKFRPATLGRDAQARPSIRPVRPSAPPPPPSPPRRKNPSGVGPRGLGAVAPRSTAAAPADHYDDEDCSTAQGNGLPATLPRGPQTLSFEAPNARRGRSNALAISYDDETQARPVDDRVLDELRQGAALAKAPVNLGIDYESLPSLEVRGPYDTYEAEFAERDPVTQLQVQKESAQVRRSDRAARREASYEEPSVEVPSFPEPSYSEPAYPQPAAPQNDHAWDRREESGSRERPDARAYSAPAPSYDDVGDSARWAHDQGAQPPAGWSSIPAADEIEPPMIPPAPRVPDAMGSGFVMGVQPIRAATPDAWGTPHAYTPVPPQAPPPSYAPAASSRPPAYAQQGHYGPGQQAQSLQYHQQQYAQAQQAPVVSPGPGTSYPAPHYPAHAAHAGQRHLTPAPMHPNASGAMAAVSPSLMMRAQPLGAQVAEAPSTSAKIGRFAWFVAGAAFGVTFAFFATGFFNGKLPSELTTAPQLPPPAMTAPAATIAPAALTAPAAPTASAAGVAAPVAAAATAPAVAQIAPSVAPPVAFATPATLAAAPPMLAAPGAPPVAAAPSAPAAPAARPAPPSHASRAQAPRRPAPPPAAPVSQAPKNLGGGGPGADDEPRSPPLSAPAGDLGDLLGAGLRP